MMNYFVRRMVCLVQG